jgi:hypothetical protein
MSDERPLPTPLPEGARCAIHPDREAARTCTRCGNYMCSVCTSEGTSGLCLTCASRLGSSGVFPYSREHFTLDGLLNLSLSRWKANWLFLTVGFGAILIASYAISLGGDWLFERLADTAGPDSGLHSQLHPARLAFQIAMTLINVAAQLIITAVSLDLLQGRKAELQRGITALRRFPDVLLQTLIMYAALAVDLGLHYALYLALSRSGSLPMAVLTALGVWLALLPVRVYVGLGIMFSTPVLLVDAESNALSAFAKSWQLVSGHRLQALGVSLVCALIGGAGVIACCVGVFVALPIGTLLYCALFLALDNREGTSALPHEGFHV